MRVTAVARLERMFLHSGDIYDYFARQRYRRLDLDLFVAHRPVSYDCKHQAKISHSRLVLSIRQRDPNTSAPSPR